MTGSDPIEPNQIADTYQAFCEYDELVSRIAAARESITGETESTFHIFGNLIGDKRAEFGQATATRNSFTMAEYREHFDEELPTIQTEGLRPAEREPLEWLGIIDRDERFRLPCHPDTGDRLHIWPLSEGLNPDYDLIEDFSVPQSAVTLFHISDTHLGYHNRLEPGGGGRTKWADRADSFTAFDAVLYRAIEAGVDAVVHTGDLFDHDVDQDTLDQTVSAIEMLADNGIPFYFILGDHDRLATGGNIAAAADAVSRLRSLSESGTVTHCTATGRGLAESGTMLFGLDATGIGFTEIRHGYRLNGWSPENVELEASEAGKTNILCLHEPVKERQISAIIDAANQRGQPLDAVLLGHEHSPPFDGEWRTTIGGVSVAYAGPTIPISSHFNEHVPGYNRVRIGSGGNLSIERQELS